jgi:hypothetical protein
MRGESHVKRLAAAAIAILAVLTGCAGGGGDPTTPEPTEVDYTTFSDTLITGKYTGALSLALTVGGKPALAVTGRIALAGEEAGKGHTAVSSAQGYWRVGNVPGGDYELFLSGPTITSDIIAITVTAGKITARTIELKPAP